MNIKCIRKELLLIINSRKKYADEYILYAFAILELLDIIKSTVTIPQDFITYIMILHEHINCDMDIHFIEELQQDRHRLSEFINPTVNSSSDDLTGSTSDSPSKSNSSTTTDSLSIGNKSLDELVSEMLKKDAQVIGEIMSDQEEYTDINMTKNVRKRSKDDYGPLDRNLLRKAKIFFNIIDIDGDGYISANDTIKVLEFHKKNPLIFPFDLVRTVVNLLREGKKIDFYVFVMYFL